MRMPIFSTTDTRLMYVESNRFLYLSVMIAKQTSAGCCLLPRHALDDFHLGQDLSIETEFFMRHLPSTRFDGVKTSGQFVDIDVLEDYLLAQTTLANL